jgi:prenyltransferase beta subunit
LMATGGSAVDRKLRAIFTAAIPFVMARHKTTGGFGATPRLPASIEDTYHALNILCLARHYNAIEDDAFAPGTDDALRSYLDACRRSLPAGAGTILRLLCCCRTVGLALDPHAVEATVIDRMRAYVSLEEWYCSAGILVEVLGRKPPLVADERGLAVILDRDWRSVDEAWMHMYLSRKFRNTLPRPAPALIAWFRACQNGDGGFGFFPGTTSFVENCHASLRALALLGGEPQVPHLAFDFLSSCQTAAGGFGRSPRAASFLDTTWHALAGIALLDKIMKGNDGTSSSSPGDLTAASAENCQYILQRD